MRELAVSVLLLSLTGPAIGFEAAARQGQSLAVAKAWTAQTLTYRAPAPPGAFPSDASFEPGAGRKLVVAEIVLQGADATLKLPEITLADAKGRYEAVGSAGTVLDNFQPFSGFVSGWVESFGPAGPDGPTVRIGRDKEGDPIQFALKGAGARLFLVFAVPAETGPLTLSLGIGPALPLKLTN